MSSEGHGDSKDDSQNTGIGNGADDGATYRTRRLLGSAPHLLSFSLAELGDCHCPICKMGMIKASLTTIENY